MSTTNTTNATDPIRLPSYPHVADPWKFATNDHGTIVFRSVNKTFDLEFVIFLGWDDPQPHAELNPSGSITITDAANLYDLVDAVDEFRAWLQDCADAFAWVQKVDAEHGIEALTTQEAVRRATPHVPRESDEEDEADTLPFVWADAGMDCTVNGDVNTSVYEFTGGVGVDDLGACAVTKRRYFTKTGEARGSAEETFRLDSAEGEIPAAGAFRVAAAIALAVAGMDANRPTAQPNTVDDLAQRIAADAHALIG